MIRGIATCALCVVAPAAAETAPNADDLVRYAHCVGQGDGYAEAAARYGFDADAHRLSGDASIVQLSNASRAPEERVLLRARAAGRQAWLRRAQIIQQGGASGEAASAAQADATGACQILGQELREYGIID